MYREIFRVDYDGSPPIRDTISDDDVIVDRYNIESTKTTSKLAMDIVTSEWKPRTSHTTWLVVMWPDKGDTNSKDMIASLKSKYCVRARITYISPLQKDKRLIIYMSYGGYLLKFEPSYDKLSELSGMMVGDDIFVSISYALS